jgi:small subunit ribosomal protein S20
LARHLSVEKRARQNKVRNQRNRIVKSSIRGLYKDIETNTDPENAPKLASRAQKVFDKAASKNVVHWKKAARMKSRAMKQLAKKD